MYSGELSVLLFDEDSPLESPDDSSELFELD